MDSKNKVTALQWNPLLYLESSYTPFLVGVNQPFRLWLWLKVIQRRTPWPHFRGWIGWHVQGGQYRLSFHDAEGLKLWLMKIWRKHDPRVMDVEFRGCTKEGEVWRWGSSGVTGKTTRQVPQEGSLASMVWVEVNLGVGRAAGGREWQGQVGWACSAWRAQGLLVGVKPLGWHQGALVHREECELEQTVMGASGVHRGGGSVRSGL